MNACSTSCLWCFCFVIVAIVHPSLQQMNGQFWWMQENPFGNGRGNENEALMESASSSEGSPDLIVVTPPVVESPNQLLNVPESEMVDETNPEDNLRQSPPEVPDNGAEACVCVEYYLCDANNRIITTGEGIIDVRLSSLAQECPGVQVCCGLPIEFSTTTTTATAVNPGTKPPKLPITAVSSCGVKGGDLDPLYSRILNDEDSSSTNFAEFPWMLALLRAEDKDGKMEYNVFQCGASLIHPQIALTAAHCVMGRNEIDLKIRAGEWETQSNDELLPYQEQAVSRIIRHPDFYSGALYNDIALLILDSPLQITTNVLPVCLPEQDAVFDGSRCLATGWGMDAFKKGAKYQTVMKKVELPIVSTRDCQDSLRSTRLGSYFRLHQSFLCAGGEPNKDTCKGDGGGPLFCKAPNSEVYVQVGVVSWGIGCGDNGIPAVYANVAQYRNWIENTVRELGL